MEIRQLKAFLAIAEAKTFTAGARRVNVTQAAISMQIKQLEDLGEVLNLLSNSPLYSERLVKLRELEELINKQLSRWDTLKSADEYLATAMQRGQESTRLKAEAETLLANATVEATQILDAAHVEKSDILVGVDEAMKRVDDAEAQLERNQEILARDMADVATQRDRLLESQAKVDGLQAELLQQKSAFALKLAQFQALAEG